MKKKKLVAPVIEKIRTVIDSDLDDILIIENSCYASAWSYEMFQQELENPAARFICYVDNDVICGYLCYWYVAGEIEILNLATTVHRQRLGIARQLLEFAFSQYDSDRLDNAFLEVRSGNFKALALYEKVGFIKSGIRPKYYRDGEDAILMIKHFTT